MTNPMINAALAAAIANAKKNEDQTKVQESKGYEPPKEGKTMGRFVGYLELGKKAKQTQHGLKTQDRVRLVFELIGPKHPPAEYEVEGVKTKVPVRMTIDINKTFSDKGNYIPLFRKMNYEGKATHMAELLGQHYLLEVIHSKSADGKKTYANLNDADWNYKIDPPRLLQMDETTGEEAYKPLNCGPALTEIKCFLWDFCDKAMWDSIYIPGKYPERKDDKGVVIAPAKSKNTIQETIKDADNYIGSAAYNICAAGGDELEIPDADVPGKPDPKPEPAPAADLESVLGEGAVAMGADDPLAGL